jgi:hypothetical protein
VRRTTRSDRYAERVLDGFDDNGNAEQTVLAIDRGDDGIWVVTRAVNPGLRSTDEPAADDQIIASYELDEALDRANEALEDDVRVLEEEGLEVRVPPFTRKEILPRLERWFLRDS